MSIDLGIPFRPGELFADQKPRKGDPVFYRGEPAGVVVRVEGNLCWTTATKDAPFIWRFERSRELNNLHDWPTKREPRQHVCDEWCQVCEERPGL